MEVLESHPNRRCRPSELDRISFVYRVDLTISSIGSYVRNIPIRLSFAPNHRRCQQLHILKQVELNTIAASFGALSDRVASMHRYVTRYHASHASPQMLYTGIFMRRAIISTLHQSLSRRISQSIIRSLV